MTHSHVLHVWNIYLQNWLIYGVNVGKYSSTMEHMTHWSPGESNLQEFPDLSGSSRLRLRQIPGHLLQRKGAGFLRAAGPISSVSF